jgi:3-hydroxybutyryl-CoA dehydrogenase
MAVKTLVVVGAGQMGAGIAQVAAQSGLAVVLVDVGADLLQKGLAGIRAQIDRAVSKGKIRADEAEAALGRLRGASSAQEARDADFAVEAVTENEGVKKKVFQDLAKALKPDAILATNTLRFPSRGSPPASSGRTRRRHALHEPRAGDATRRDHPRRADEQRDL